MTEQNKQIKIEIENSESIDIDIPSCPMCNGTATFDDNEESSDISTGYIVLTCENARCCMEKWKVQINLNFE